MVESIRDKAFVYLKLQSKIIIQDLLVCYILSYSLLYVLTQVIEQGQQIAAQNPAGVLQDCRTGVLSAIHLANVGVLNSAQYQRFASVWHSHCQSYVLFSVVCVATQCAAHVVEKIWTVEVIEKFWSN